MAPITFTETELESPKRTKDWIENSTISLTHRAKESTKNESCSTKLQTDSYDKMLRPEPSFLKPIRRLEKRMGFVTPLRWTNIVAIFSIHFLALAWAIHFLALGKTVKLSTVLFGKCIKYLPSGKGDHRS